MSMLPGMVPITLYFLALALTSDLVVTELETGVLSRDWVHGVNTVHSLVCQVSVQMLVVILQILSSVVMMTILYHLSFRWCRDSPFLQY